MNSVQLLLAKLILFSIIMFVYITYYRRFNNNDYINRIVFALHIIVLGLFFAGSLDAIFQMMFSIGIPNIVLDMIFDILWWSMSGIGMISCVNLLKERSKLAYFLFPTTVTFLLFIVPMMILTNM